VHRVAAKRCKQAKKKTVILMKFKLCFYIFLDLDKLIWPKIIVIEVNEKINHIFEISGAYLNFGNADGTKRNL
jgi:hypothetical protein